MAKKNKKSKWNLGKFLRAEMTRKSITSEELCKRLEKFGVTEKPLNINNKLSRGTFNAVFFVQCLKAIDYEKCHIDVDI